MVAASIDKIEINLDLMTFVFKYENNNKNSWQLWKIKSFPSIFVSNSIRKMSYMSLFFWLSKHSIHPFIYDCKIDIIVGFCFSHEFQWRSSSSLSKTTTTTMTKSNVKKMQTILMIIMRKWRLKILIPTKVYLTWRFSFFFHW